MRSWESRDALEAAVVDHQANWWRDDPDALAVINDSTTHPGLRGQILATAELGQIVTTAAIYRPTHPGAPDDRPYAEVREPVHDRIATACVPSKRNGTERPVAYFTMGCPGAGKTSLLRGIVEEQRRRASPDTTPEPMSVIDADQVRQSLPEYADGLGAVVVQEECFYLTYGRVFDRAVKSRNDIVYDTIGRLTSIRDNLDLLRSEGYEVHVLLARSPLELCEARTESRALNVDGRLVPPSMLRRAAEDAEQAMGALVGEGTTVAGWAKIDNTDMAAPSLIDGSSPWADLF